MPRTTYDDIFTRQGDGSMALVSSVPRTITAQDEYMETLEAQLTTGTLSNLSPAGASAWIDANVLSLAAARTALKLLAGALIALRDEKAR